MSLWSRIANTFRAGSVNREIDDELQCHIADAIEDGRDPAEARRAFGPALLCREESRDIRLIPWVDGLWQDLKHGVRVLRRSLGLTIAGAALLLAGIGVYGV